MKQTLIILAVLISFFSYSQSQTQDVIYLKNGSIIKGSVTEMNPSTGIKIKTAGGSLFVYQMSEILKMEKEEFKGTKDNQETSSTVSASAITKFFKDYLSQKRPALALIDVSKKNGIKKDIFGQKVYEIEYELVVEAKQNIYINPAVQFGSAFSSKFIKDLSYTKQDAGGYEAAIGGKKQLIKKGQRITLDGQLDFEQTDNGWRATSFDNKNFRTVSSNYMAPKSAEQKQDEEKQRIVDTQKKQEENKKKLEQYQTQGDWNRADTPTLNIIPNFYQSSHIPFFNHAMIIYSLNKSSEACSDCRNDNIQALERAFKKAINNTDRYAPSSIRDKQGSKNISTVEFSVTNITFTHLGIEENGDNKGYSCRINYEMTTDEKYTSPETVTLHSVKKGTNASPVAGLYRDKASAFSATLRLFEKSITKFVYNREPLELSIKRIETNRKGKITAIVLEKPQPFISLNKGEAIVYKKGDMTVQNNALSLKQTLGKCKWKKSDDELVCKISGSKDKKIFSKVQNDLVSKYVAMLFFK